MKIILTSPINNLGQIGSIVTVKDGYARNFLIPKNLAKKFSKKELEKFNQQKQALQETNKLNRTLAEQVVEKLSNITVKIYKRSSMEGNLYGSVVHRDIIDALKKESINIESRQIVMHHRIKALGEYKVQLDLYDDISTELDLLVINTDQ